MTPLRTIYNDLVAEHAANTSGEMVTTFSDKGTMHSYIEYYETWFEPHRSLSSILEIGVMTGGSALLWHRYFDSVTLAGVDLRQGFNQPLPFQNEIPARWYWGVDSTQADQTPALDQFQFVIDDGAHDAQSQIETMKNYWQFVEPGGTYFIEDVEDDASELFLLGWIRGWLQDQPHSVTRYRGFDHRADDRIIAVTREIK